MAEQKTTKEILEQRLQEIQEFLLQFKEDFLERINPMVESLRPVWSDPLWQFIAVIVLIVLLLALFVWLLRMGSDMAEGLLGLIVLPFVALKKALAGELLSSLRERAKTQADERLSWRWQHWQGMRRAMDALRYLTTRRDWRYQSPWYLLAGHDDSAKSEWINSIKKGRRSQLLVKEKNLLAEGSDWHFFDQGVIIEAEDEKSFKQTVELLNFYRPERPMDGIILTVSAEALLQTTDPGMRDALGETLYKQLWHLQKTSGFVVPVYIMVTQCHHVRGFEAFWSALSEGGSDEMFGWSNPHRLDTAFTPRWVDEAFDYVMDSVSKAQLDVAAGGKDIADRDGFILFDREFNGLRTLLSEVIVKAFARSSFQEALPLRGIWFSGEIEDHISLNEDFLVHKLWPETHLAYPVEQSRFSINRTLRRFQFASLVLAGLFLITLLSDTYRLRKYSQESEKMWEHMSFEGNNSEACKHAANDTGSDTWWLLSSLSKLSDQPTTFSFIPWWFGGQLPKLQEASAEILYPKKVFPSLQCRFRERAKALDTKKAGEINKDEELLYLKTRLREHVAALLSYQKNQNDFVLLSGPLQKDARGVGERFRNLVDYLYDSAIPGTIDFNSPLISGAVIETAFDIELSEKKLVEPKSQLSYLSELAGVVREKIEQQVLQPPFGEMRKAFLTNTSADSISVDSSSSYSGELSSGEEMLASVKAFKNWVHLSRQFWLSTNEENSPCGLIYRELDELQGLLLDAAYPKAPMELLVKDFQTENCDTAIREKMATLNVAPLGNLFINGSGGALQASPQLLHWKDELDELESLNLLSRKYQLPLTEMGSKLSSSQEDASAGKIVSWKSAPLDEALEVLLAFQSFRQKWWKAEPGQVSEPFYAPALRALQQRVVSHLIRQSQTRELEKAPEALSAGRDPEVEMAARISNFQRANSSLRQLAVVLQQEGDNGNAVYLRNSSREFVQDQLGLLKQLASENRLYQPLQKPLWQRDNFAAALFSYSDKAELGSYLQNQRQRTDYLAQNYARPLVSYLLDSGGIDMVNKNATLWLDTLTDLRRYQRKEPGNGVAELEEFIANELVKLTESDCNTWLAQPGFSHTSGGLFNVWHYRIDNNLRKHCQTWGKTTVMKHYLALAERFNKELAGRFPFADIQLANSKDVEPKILREFLADFQSTWLEAEDTTEGKQAKTLQAQLKDLVAAQPALSLGGWLEFVDKLETIAKFWALAKADDGSLSVPLGVEFAVLPQQSLGGRQIVEWQLFSGDNSIRYPNGGNSMDWRPGEKMRLALRWASGSEYMPTHDYQSPVQIDPQSKSALFSSEGPWALFEWLQQFGSTEKTSVEANLLTFSVRVASQEQVKNQSEKLEKSSKEKENNNVEPKVAKGSPETDRGQPSAYMSRVNMRLNASIKEKDGSEKKLALPMNLPYLAPGLPGDQVAQGGNSRAASSNN